MLKSAIESKKIAFPCLTLHRIRRIINTELRKGGGQNEQGRYEMANPNDANHRSSNTRWVHQAKRALQTSPSRQMIQTIKELRCKRANALLATSLYHMEVVKWNSMILSRWDFGSHHCPSSISVRNLYKAQLRRQYFVVTQCGESENENHRRSDDDSGSCRTLGNFCDHSKAGVLRTKGASASF